MALAKGAYLYFMDSDDVTRPFLFSRILKEIADTPDFVFSAWERIGEAGEFLPHEGPFFRDFMFSKDPARRLEQLLDGDFYSLIGATFFRRKFVENLEIIFPANIARGEDDVFIQQCLLFAESVIVIPEKLLLYRKRQGAITEFPISISLHLMFQGRIAQSLRLLGTIRRKGLEMPDFESFLEFRARQNIFLLVRDFLLKGREDLALCALGDKAIRRNLLDLVRTGEHEFEHRFKSGLALWFPALFLLWYRNR